MEESNIHAKRGEIAQTHIEPLSNITNGAHRTSVLDAILEIAYALPEFYSSIKAEKQIYYIKSSVLFQKVQHIQKKSN